MRAVRHARSALLYLFLIRNIARALADTLELVTHRQVHQTRVLARLRVINNLVVPGRAATRAGPVRLDILALLARGDAELPLIVHAVGALGPARVRVVVAQARLRALPRLRVPEHRRAALRDHVFAVYHLEVLAVPQLALAVPVRVPVRPARALGNALLGAVPVHVHAQRARVIAVEASVDKALARRLARARRNAVKRLIIAAHIFALSFIRLVSAVGDAHPFYVEVGALGNALLWRA